MKTALFTFLATSALAFAQPVPTATAEESERTRVERAMLLAKAGDAEAAEREIVGTDRVQRDTVAARTETALRLLQLAHDVPRQHARMEAVPGLVQSAVQHLARAEALASSAEEKGNARALLALVQERYLGDQDAALQSYQAALKLAPEHAQAKRQADRLERTKRIQADRARNQGGTN